MITYTQKDTYHIHKIPYTNIHITYLRGNKETPNKPPAGNPKNLPNNEATDESPHK